MCRRAILGIMILGLATGVVVPPRPATAESSGTPSRPQLPGPSAPLGTLVIAGGGDLPQDVVAAFVAAAGGKGATIGVLPVASSVPEQTVADLRAPLTSFGATLRLIDVRRRADAESPASQRAARQCTGYWFTGGDQNRIGDFIVGTALHRLIMARYQAGAVVGGTSAGAAAMSQIMLTGEGALGETAPGSFKTRTGLGFLTNCIVDQHFLRRSRHNRLLSLIQEHPNLLGLGIDEETALRVHAGTATVIGRRRVLIFDAVKATIRAGTLAHLQVHLLGPGQAVALDTRAISSGQSP